MEIKVFLSEATFRRFTIFDILKRRKLWRSPVIFAAILSFCAFICFLAHHIDGAVLLGSILLIVGLGMPCVYFTTFFFSLRKQVKQNHLTPPKHVYTVKLSHQKDGIFIENTHEQATYCWDKVFHVYQDTNATYLYMTPDRAFLLPHDCVEGSADALWALIQEMVPPTKYTVVE